VDKTNYRPDVDGLRAVAVSIILLFHVGFARFSGGFVGVDVFFVISGFLITRMIIGDIAEGKFTFANFYERRARRLFPALYFTLVLCFVSACFILSPKLMQDFGGSLLYASSSQPVELGFRRCHDALTPLRV
jgi:peptidoglycan/LPS O-acetylase OafA/YrhL